MSFIKLTVIYIGVKNIVRHLYQFEYFGDFNLQIDLKLETIESEIIYHKVEINVSIFYFAL